MPRDVLVVKIQRELCHPKCTRKVSETGPWSINLRAPTRRQNEGFFVRSKLILVRVKGSEPLQKIPQLKTEPGERQDQLSRVTKQCLSQPVKRNWKGSGFLELMKESETNLKNGMGTEKHCIQMETNM